MVMLTDRLVSYPPTGTRVSQEKGAHASAIALAILQMILYAFGLETELSLH